MFQYATTKCVWKAATEGLKGTRTFVGCPGAGDGKHISTTVLAGQ